MNSGKLTHVTAYARFFPFYWFSTSLKEVNVFLYNICCRQNRNSSVGKESACNAGDPSSIPGLKRSPGEGKGYPLQYSGLENSMEFCIVHGIAKSQIRLSDFHFFKQEKKNEKLAFGFEKWLLDWSELKVVEVKVPPVLLVQSLFIPLFCFCQLGVEFYFLIWHLSFPFSTLYCQGIN